MYKIEICRDLNQIIEREKEWKSFEKHIDNQNITSSYDWNYNFLITFMNREDNQFGYNKKLLIMFLYKEGNLIGICPFIKITKKKYGLRATFIEFIGQQWAATFLDILGKDLTDSEVNIFIDYIYKNEKFDVLQLKYIPDRTQNFKVNSKGFTVLSACPYINVSNYESFDDFKDKEYSKNLKRNFIKAKNKIGNQGYTLESFSTNISDENFSEIISVSKRKLADGKHSIYLDEYKKNFVKTMIQVMESNVSLSYVNNKLSAYRLNFFYGNYKYSFDASYERDYKKFELGAHSIETSIEDSFNKKVVIHSEGTGIDPYKMKFMQGLEKIYSFTRKGNTLKSSFLYRREIKKALLTEEEYYKGAPVLEK